MRPKLSERTLLPDNRCLYLPDAGDELSERVLLPDNDCLYLPDTGSKFSERVPYPNNGCIHLLDVRPKLSEHACMPDASIPDACIEKHVHTKQKNDRGSEAKQPPARHALVRYCLPTRHGPERLYRLAQAAFQALGEFFKLIWGWPETLQFQAQCCRHTLGNVPISIRRWPETS